MKKKKKRNENGKAKRAGQHFSYNIKSGKINTFHKAEYNRANEERNCVQNFAFYAYKHFSHNKPHTRGSSFSIFSFFTIISWSRKWIGIEMIWFSGWRVSLHSCAPRSTGSDFENDYCFHYFPFEYERTKKRIEWEGASIVCDNKRLCTNW